MERRKGGEMRKIALTAVMVLGFFGAGVAWAGEVDVLIAKLVDKGVLTASEGQIILDETKADVAKQNAKMENSAIPAWVQGTKLKGDFRLRYQHDHTKKLPSTTTPTDRDRARIRLRLGLESKINDKLLVGIGLATGLNDGSADASRSTNATLDNSFSKYSISLDYAYAQYTPYPWATFFGGKFKNPLWEPGDLIWDTDINPAGGAVKLSKKVSSKTELFVNTGVLLIDESGNYSADPTMYVVQPGFTQQLTDTISLKGAFSYYGFSGVEGKKLDGAAGTNFGYTVSGSTVNGALLYNYTNIIPALELSIKEPLKMLKLNVPYASLFGEYVQNVNSDVKHDNAGFMIGGKLGAEKIEKWADWQVRYNYAMLGRDATLDILPDSDRYGGKTGMRSHEIMFDWGLGKNTWLGLDCYYGWQLPGNFGQTQTKPASVIQVDWNMKF
jgi:hypothetical protein